MSRRIHKRLYSDHGAYFYVARSGGKVKWTKLSADYGEALRKWAEIEGGAKKTSWTVAEAIANYLAVSANRLSKATMVGYTQNTRQLLPVFGAMSIDDVTRADVYAYVVKRGNYAGNRERGLLSAVYAHLGRCGVFNGINPAAGMRFRNPEKPRKRYVSDDELHKLLAAASPRMRTLFSFAYLTGMRQADVIGLKLTAATDEGIAYTIQKTGESHLIAWTDELRALWKEAARNRIGAQPLFLARDGIAYKSSGLQTATRRIAKRAGLENLHFHDLRRKAGSDSADLAHAQELLGHADSNVTRRHYRAKLVAATPVDMPSVRQKPKR